MMQYGRSYGYGYNGMMGGGGGGWFVGLLMLLFFAAIVVLVVLLVIWAVRASSGHGHALAAPHSQAQMTPPTSAAGHDEAVAIAKRRLASGEITTDEYSEIMRHLAG